MKKLFLYSGVILSVPIILYLYINEARMPAFMSLSVAIGIASLGIALLLISFFIKKKPKIEEDSLKKAFEEKNDKAINSYIWKMKRNDYFPQIPKIGEIREHYELRLSTAKNFTEEYEAVKASLNESVLDEIFLQRFSVELLNKEQRYYKYQQYINSVGAAPEAGVEYRRYLRTMLSTYNNAAGRILLAKECKADMLTALNKSTDPLLTKNLEDALELFRMEVGMPTYWHFIYETSLESYNPKPNFVNNECWMDVKNECLIISDDDKFPLKEAHENTCQYFKAGATSTLITSYQPSCQEEYDKANYEEYEQVACIHVIKICKPAS